MKPNTRTVVDFGFRDVGVKNEPKKIAAGFAVKLVVLWVLLSVLVIATCVFFALTDFGSWVALPVAIVITVISMAYIFRTSSTGAPVVVKIRASGQNPTAWLPLGMTGLTLAIALLTTNMFFALAAVPMLVISIIAARHRGVAPVALASIQSLLEPGEVVLGDCNGNVMARKWHLDGGRIVVATDRRLLVAKLVPNLPDSPVASIPYENVKSLHYHWGRFGTATMSIEFVRADPLLGGAATIAMVGPMNLMSVVAAADEHGVSCVGPALEARPASRGDSAASKGEPTARLVVEPREQLDRAVSAASSQRSMPDLDEARTREFEAGLWVFVGVTALLFFGDTLGLSMLSITNDPQVFLIGFPAACFLAGFISRTAWSVLYVVPMCLMLTLSLLVMSMAEVLHFMFLMTMAAVPFLLAGAWLRTKTSGALPAEVGGTPEART